MLPLGGILRIVHPTATAHYGQDGGNCVLNFRTAMVIG